MELVPDDDPVKGLGDFYDFLWGEQDGYVYLPNKERTPDDKGLWEKIMFAWPADKAKVIRYTLATTAKGRDVYAAPAIFNDKRPVKENVKGSYTLWVDFDGNAPKEWRSDVPVSEQEQGPDGRTASDGPLVPTLRIMSSKAGHEHVYWRLEEFSTDIDFIENTNRAMAYKFEADTSGWDINQVLRPPHTTNYKHNLPVKIEASTDRSYSRENFGAFKRVKQVVSDSISLDVIPQVTKVIAKYTWDDHHFDLFMKSDIEEGKRSSALMALGYFGAEKGMTNEEIYALLINADDRWGKFKNRTDREKRLLDIINRARQKHPVGSDSKEFELRGLLSSGEDVKESPQYVFGFREFNKLEIELEWVVEGLLERQGMGLVASAPGVGKTQLSLQLGTSCALGETFIYWKIPRPLKVLWFSLEMIAPALQYFTHQMQPAFDEKQMDMLEENLKIVPLGEVLPLDTEAGKVFIEALIEEYEPDVIMIDSMGKVTHESLNDETKAKKLNAYYAVLRKKYDLSIWFVHHNRKANGDNKKPKELSDVYGNQYISADLTSAISLWKDDDGNIELNVIKSRLSKEVKPVNLLRTEQLRYVPKEDGFLENSPLVKDKEVSGESKPNDGNGISRRINFDL